MRRLSVLWLVALLVCSPASASPVSWGSYRLLSSSERESPSGYVLTAREVSGRLSLTRDATYSLSFQGGQVRIGSKLLGAGCSSGKLGKGTVLLFERARRVTFHIPSRGCPRR